MRRLFMILVSSIFAAGIALYAQDTALECPDGSTYDNALRLIAPPNVSSPLLPPNAPADTPLPYVLTVLELQGNKPILAVSGDNDFAACVPVDPRATVYSANLPTTGEVPASPLSSGIVVPPQPTSIEIALANVSADYGEFLLFIEGVSSMTTDDEGDVYTLPVTPGMLASGVPFTAYVIALDANYDAALALVDADGQILRDENNQPITCDNADDTETCYGESASLEGAFIAGFRNQRFEGKPTDAMLTLPLSDALLETGIALRVNTSAANGEYALIIHAASGAKPDTTVAATLEEANDGTLTVMCANGATIAEGVRLELPALAAETTYRVTAVGSGEMNPSLAVFKTDGTGSCHEDTAGAEQYAAVLPDGNYSASNRTAQAELPPDTAFIVVGNSAATSGSVALIIEGFAYAAAAEATETPIPQLDLTQQFATAQAGATQTLSALESSMTQTAVFGQILLTQTAVAAQPEATLPPDAVLDAPQIVGDTFAIQVSPGMADAEGSMFVYMLAVDRTLNPLLAWVDENNTVMRDELAQLVICNDAGVPQSCHADLPSLAGYQVTVAENRILPGFTPDAALRLFLSEDDAGDLVRVVATTPDKTSGAYVLLLTLTPR